MTTAKRKIIKQNNTYEIAEAFGLGRESLQKAKYMDSFGPVVIWVHAPCGYTTAVGDDELRRGGSVIAVTDGYPTHLPFEWVFRNTPNNRAITVGYIKGFRLYCATFAATGVQTGRGVIPERIFLFPGSHGFNLTKIIERLRQHRTENEVSVLPDLHVRSLV